MFAQKSFSVCFEDRLPVFVGGLGGILSNFCCLGNRLENSVFLNVTLGILNGTRKSRHGRGDGTYGGLDPHKVIMRLHPSHNLSLGWANSGASQPG